MLPSNEINLQVMNLDSSEFFPLNILWRLLVSFVRQITCPKALISQRIAPKPRVLTPYSGDC